MCQRNYTYGDLLCIQVCSDAKQMHCSTGKGKIASSLFSAALQNSLVSLQMHLWIFALHTGLQ